MYYRGAAAAVVVYDITNAVHAKPHNESHNARLLLGFLSASQELGQGIAAPGQPQHCDSSGGEQIRFGE